MNIIEVIYDDGSNGLIEMKRRAKKQHKRICEMTTAEILATGCGIFRK